MQQQQETEQLSHDFDFLFGQWRINNTRLVKFLEGCTEWETFEATSKVWPLPGGIGNYDEFIAETWRPGYVGMSFRVFSTQAQTWSIYWLDNLTSGVDAQGFLNPPVVGRFENGIGLFEGSELFNGKPIRVRFKWSDITAQSALWEQWFSEDDGQTWETNWIMEFHRLDQSNSIGQA